MTRTNPKNGPVGTILVTDDTSVIRLVCQRALENAGHRVLLASTGEEAVKVARAEDIDIALLDIKMPGISGIEVLRAIKSDKPLVEVIMMTAFASQDVAEEATRLGASGFLTKPFPNVRVLTEAVSEALTKKRLAENGIKGELKIEELLLKDGLIDDEGLKQAIERAERTNTSIKDAILAMGLAQAEDFDWVLAKSLDIPFVRLDESNIDPEAVKRIPARLARRYRIMPLMIEKRAIHIAVDDPFNKDALDIIRRKHGLEPIMVKGFGPEIDRMIEYFYPEFRHEIDRKIAALDSNASPKLIMEIMEEARSVEFTEVHFEPRPQSEDSKGDGRKSWSFKIAGVLIEAGEEKK